MAKKTGGKKKPEIPSKLYYSISEVAALTAVKPHVLRYWESEFPSLKPRKTRTGARRYRQTDIDEIRAIKHLLYEEGYKISGAVKMRRQSRKAAPAVESSDQMAMDFSGMTDAERLAVVKDELKDILKLVKQIKAKKSTPRKKAAEA